MPISKLTCVCVHANFNMDCNKDVVDLTSSSDLTDDMEVVDLTLE